MTRARHLYVGAGQPATAGGVTLGEARADETVGNGDGAFPTVGVVAHAGAKSALRTSARIHFAVLMSLQQ
ncbi:MAG TPA: hypothetical protein VIP57_18150 [Candidatus Dormibacteraeota bacterium]